MSGLGLNERPDLTQAEELQVLDAHLEQARACIARGQMPKVVFATIDERGHHVSFMNGPVSLLDYAIRLALHWLLTDRRLCPKCTARFNRANDSLTEGEHAH